jgi:hypothetical protein
MRIWRATKRRIGASFPRANQNSRDQLIAAGQSYFDYFKSNTGTVPWGNPCYRLEGGKGCTPAIDQASPSCNVGIPMGVTFATPHWVVDLDIQSAVGMTRMGGDFGLPDIHLFRVPNGTIRYIHTMTVCTTPNCGM